MTYEQLAEYLAQGGTDMQYVLESIADHCPDEVTKALIAGLFANIEAE
jgi:hypothetical protein